MAGSFLLQVSRFYDWHQLLWVRLVPKLLRDFRETAAIISPLQVVEELHSTVSDLRNPELDVLALREEVAGYKLEIDELKRRLTVMSPKRRDDVAQLKAEVQNLRTWFEGTTWGRGGGGECGNLWVDWRSLWSGCCAEAGFALFVSQNNSNPLLRWSFHFASVLICKHKAATLFWAVSVCFTSLKLWKRKRSTPACRTDWQELKGVAWRVRRLPSIALHASCK